MLRGVIKRGPNAGELTFALFRNADVTLVILMDNESNEREVKAKITGMKSDGTYVPSSEKRNGFVLTGYFKPGLEGESGTSFEATYMLYPAETTYRGNIYPTSSPAGR